MLMTNDIIYIGAVASIVEAIFWFTAGVVALREMRKRQRQAQMKPAWVKAAESYMNSTSYTPTYQTRYENYLRGEEE